MHFIKKITISHDLVNHFIVHNFIFCLFTISINVFFRSSILLSSSFPSSQQSPEVKRKSWNPTRETSNSNSNHDLDSDSSDIPLNYEDAKDEVMNFIYQLNSVFRYKQAEAGLSRFKGKLPALFEDLCFYSDVCHVLGEYNFRINARKFIQVLFNSLDISQVIIIS